MNAKMLSIMRYQDDINTEHNMKSIYRTAVAQWTKRLIRTGQTRVRNWKNANSGFRVGGGRSSHSPLATPLMLPIDMIDNKRICLCSSNHDTPLEQTHIK